MHNSETYCYRRHHYNQKPIITPVLNAPISPPLPLSFPPPIAELVYRSELKEGRKLYGSKFHNYEVFTSMHNSETYCYHGGDQFITTHAAFTQMLDEALQSVNPRLTQPYWDFMVDSAALGEEWYKSVIYDDDW
jgi:hypothetical protein